MTEQAAIYLRVSTDGQTVVNQRPELERLARERYLLIGATHTESASATRAARSSSA
jgi:DNA invertase Pin-like site-specific DNA recombinase